VTRLTREGFLRARAYIFAHGGDVDRAWFRYVFEDGDAEAFLKALAEYQHSCGGFGGLYHEFAYQGPCLKSTEIAVKYLLGMREPPGAEHPLIRRTMAYLLDNYLPERGNWREVVVPQVNEQPHCPWVRFRGEDISPIAEEQERIRRYDANEKACFAAFAAQYPELVPKELYEQIIRYPAEHLLRYWDERSPEYDRGIFERGEPYAFEYFQFFVDHMKDRSMAEKLSCILRQNPTAFMELDFARSDREYVHLPCDSVVSPEGAVYPAVKELVDQSLAYRLQQQSADGRWPLGWSFGSDGAMQQLQRKYEAYRTLLMLVKLQKFGKMEC